MDMQRYLGLYVSETHEHVRLLHRSLLEIEAQPDGPSIHEAFRAAHTLKGLSAAMGFAAVAELAHRLEDRLAAVRGARVTVDAALVDAMLAEADAIEVAIAAAVSAPDEHATAALDMGDAGLNLDEPPIQFPPVAFPGAAQPADGGVPADGVRPASQAGEAVLQVRLQVDAPLKPVRAMLIVRALDDHAGVLGAEPAEFGDDFDGELRIRCAADCDVAAVQAAIMACGEVDTVRLVGDGAAPPSPVTAVTAPAAGSAPGLTVRQVRVDADRLDSLGDGIGELAVLFGRLEAHTGESGALRDTVDRMAAVLSELQHDLLKLRTVPLRHAFERLPRVVRDAARSLGRDVELVMAGEEVELDRAIVDEITEPLVHLLRNAVDHGIEPAEERRLIGKRPQGRIEVRAERERSGVRILVVDDGRGIQAGPILERARAVGLVPADAVPWVDDEELFRLLSHPGLSTAGEVGAVSGRGVGMDVVVSRIRALGGSIDMRTHTWAGTTFCIRLPTSLALTQALRVRVGGEDYVLPLTHISEVVELDGGDDWVVNVRGDEVPLIRLQALLSVGRGGGEQAAVIAGTATRRAALAVDELVGREQILVRGFDAVAGTLPYFSGATLLADGRPALVFDPLSVI